jgi:hypothetical protein
MFRIDDTSPAGLFQLLDLIMNRSLGADSSRIKGGTARGFVPGGTALAFLAPGPYNFGTTWW